MANNITQTRWADHVRGCADLAKEIAGRMDIREDPARQAMLATIIISADRHNLFLEPVPENSKTPVIQPEPAAAQSGPKKGVERDEAAANKADTQIEDIDPNPTPETADGGRRAAFMKGINSARDLLNKEGQTPPLTPGGLNAYIKNQFPNKIQPGVAGLDTEELERLVILLSSKLEVLREKNSKINNAAEALDFP